MTDKLYRVTSVMGFTITCDVRASRPEDARSRANDCSVASITGCSNASNSRIVPLEKWICDELDG